MTSFIRSRDGVFPGVNSEPVAVRDVILEGVVVGSFYQLDRDCWEFLGPWDCESQRLVDGPEDRLLLCDGTFWLYTDGASRGNPPRAAIGAVLYDSQGRKVRTLSRSIGQATNNKAEYLAFIGGLELALDHGVRCLVVRSDSKLVVNQVRRTYKVKAAKLKCLHRKAAQLLKCFPRRHLEWVPRKYNGKADGLANAALPNPSE